jgi:hypothetical protein
MKRIHRNSWLKGLVVAACLLVLAQTTSATTAVVPTDEDLIVGARAIITAKVTSIESRWDDSHSRIYSYITLRVKQVLKGTITDRKVVLKELGGIVGEYATVIYGNPQYTVGEKVLVYLDTWADGTLRTHEMFLGKFTIFKDETTGHRFVSRNMSDDKVVLLPQTISNGSSTDTMELSSYKHLVRTLLAANEQRANEFEETYYKDVPIEPTPAGFVPGATGGEFQPQFHFFSPAARWPQPDAGQSVPYTLNTSPPSSPGVPVVAVDAGDVAAAANAWSTVPGCALRVTFGSTLTDCYTSTGTPGINVVSNNCDGRNSPSSTCASILAIGGYTQARYNPKIVSGVQFSYEIIQGFVSVNPWASCSFGNHCQVQEILTHEMGHALGLHHSWDPSFGGSATTAEQQATMYWIAHFDGRCASLRQDDINGITTAYPVTGGSGLSISTSSLPNGTVGTAYSQSLVATGGSQPYSWSLVAGLGPLPTGLSLSTAGAITGTPSVAGTFNFTVGVSDSASTSIQKALSIVVSNPGAGYDSQFLSQSVPATVNPGQQFTATLSWLNTGTQTWNGSAGFVVRSQNPAGNTTWGGSQVNLTGFAWASGQTMSINVNFIAPSTAGTYNFQWQCYQSGVGYLGQPSTNVSIQVGTGGGTDGASFVSQSVPSSMTAAQSTSVSVTMHNSGTTTWVAGSYVLGSMNPAGNMTWGLNQVPLTSSVAPGANATFVFSITAPSVASTYNFQWSMLHSGVAFGTPSTNVSITVSSGGGGGSGDNAQFLSSNMPTTLNPGQFVQVTIMMKNTGTTSWGTNIHKLGSQNPANNTTWGVNRAVLAKSTPVGSTGTFKFYVTAPSTPGTYNFQWQMVNNSTGVFFGQLTPNLAVQVGSGGGGGSTDDAAFVSQSVPSSMTAGQSVAVSVTMKNSGTTTWQAGTYALGSLNPAGNTTWGLNTVNLVSSIAPGANATFNFNVAAPAVAGNYNFQWGMKKGATSFGAASTNVVVSVAAASASDNAQFVSQSVPGSLTTGQATGVSVVMKNNGTTTWSPGSYALVSRSPAGNTVWGLSTVALAGSVAPGFSATFNFTITAPSSAGAYNFQWQMQHDATGFGAFTTNSPIAVTSVSVQPLVVATTSLPYGAVGVPYSQQIVATGGVQPYTWSVSSGTLPTGVTLKTTTGVLSGTPTKGGTYSFTIMVRDANGATASMFYKVYFK